MKLEIGLYKLKIDENEELPQFEVMINKIDNKLFVHNGLFEEIATFEYNYISPKDYLKNLEKFEKVRQLHKEFTEILEKQITTKNKCIENDCFLSQQVKIKQIMEILNEK